VHRSVGKEEADLSSLSIHALPTELNSKDWRGCQHSCLIDEYTTVYL